MAPSMIFFNVLSFFALAHCLDPELAGLKQVIWPIHPFKSLYFLNFRFTWCGVMETGRRYPLTRLTPTVTTPGPGAGASSPGAACDATSSWAAGCGAATQAGWPRLTTGPRWWWGARTWTGPSCPPSLTWRGSSRPGVTRCGRRTSPGSPYPCTPCRKTRTISSPATPTAPGNWGRLDYISSVLMVLWVVGLRNFRRKSKKESGWERFTQTIKNSLSTYH